MYKGNPYKNCRHFGRNRRHHNSYYLIIPNSLWYVEGIKRWIADMSIRGPHTACDKLQTYYKKRVMKEINRIASQFPNEIIWIVKHQWIGQKVFFVKEWYYQNNIDITTKQGLLEASHETTP
jgi:hypothetical protein